MEKRSKDIDKVTQKLVNDAGLHQPSTAFLTHVMEAVSKQTYSQKVYQPLISKRGWGIFAIILVVSILLLYIFPTTQDTFIDQFINSENLSVNFQLPEFKLSKTMIYGIGFLALFLLQIPFLKRFIVKNYS